MPVPLLLLQSVGDQSSGSALLPVVVIAILLATLSGMWRLFVLAGQPGWAALIPIYNIVVLLRVAGRSGWWTLLFLVPFAGLVVMLIAASGVARRFGRGVGFTLGLWLLPFVFYPLLAFSAQRPLARVAT